MDNPTPDEKPQDKPLRSYRMPYQVAGVRSMLPMFIVEQGSSAEEAAGKALTRLTEEWTHKLGGKVGTKNQAKVEVGFQPSWDDAPPPYCPDYQI